MTAGFAAAEMLLQAITGQYFPKFIAREDCSGFTIYYVMPDRTEKAVASYPRNSRILKKQIIDDIEAYATQLAFGGGPE